MSGYVYMMANKKSGLPYIGVTNNLQRRVWEHKNNVTAGFVSKYKLYRLVWYEYFEDIEEAIAVEKQMKLWRRDWKIQAIEKMNPEWLDLYETLNQ